MTDWLVLALLYLGVAVYLAGFTMQWHVDHNSPPSHLLHDLAIAVIWPVEIVVRISRAHRRKK